MKKKGRDGIVVGDIERNKGDTGVVVNKGGKLMVEASKARTNRKGRLSQVGEESVRVGREKAARRGVMKIRWRGVAWRVRTVPGWNRPFDVCQGDRFW